MQSLRFEERALKPYPEPLAIDELEEGEVYFTIQYSGADRDGLFPIMETLVFVGFNLDEEDAERRAYFQDLESYQAGIRYKTATAEHKSIFYGQEPQHLGHIFKYESALNELLKCSLRRRKIA